MDKSVSIDFLMDNLGKKQRFNTSSNSLINKIEIRIIDNLKRKFKLFLYQNKFYY